ncbi:hypothetical protein Slin15195_G023510 [Septoria linicola]|uniref:Uncharacterized protein n=1 Tax=Septoria linicola TaxID=215465 RepID=A0A9Q9AN29_9PEZI|nr:hypothetical protein Slin14017_G022590 [Septoria linicola]USW49032.1 hypothetical protein Slin15195_G023510 [Septoria linicola]
MPKSSRLLRELRHEPVGGHSIFANPDAQSSPRPTHPRASQHGSNMSTVKRRAVRPVPATLLDQCTICMEEQLFSQAFALLGSGLNAGLDTNTPACIPPPQHLALAVTIAVHPSLTTRTDDQDKQAASNHALTYLREVLAVVGSENSGLREALQFGGPSTVRLDRSKRAKTRRSDRAYASDEEEHAGKLRSQYTEKQSIAENAQDFWSVVGWAFNCSIKHKARWARWRVWLDLVLDVLEEDLEGRSAVTGADLSKTLIAQYMSTVGAGRNNKRRIMRAVLADGTTKSMAEFGEIWKNESKPPKKQEQKRTAKRRKLDLDNDNYGDYFDNDSEEDTAANRSRRSRSATASRGRRSRTPVNRETGSDNNDNDSGFEDAFEGDSIEEFGGIASIQLRQRLLALFATFSRAAPQLFDRVNELFALYTEFMRPLPLNVFQQFVLPTRPYLNPHYQATLNEMLSRPLLGSSGIDDPIGQKEFESTFAASAATSTSAVDNAKVSLLSESLLRALWRGGHLTHDMSTLKSLVEEGIRLRHEKCAGDGRKKTGKSAYADEEARLAMECSGQRMKVLLSVIAS